MRPVATLPHAELQLQRPVTGIREIDDARVGVAGVLAVEGAGELSTCRGNLSGAQAGARRTPSAGDAAVGMEVTAQAEDVAGEQLRLAQYLRQFRAHQGACAGALPARLARIEAWAHKRTRPGRDSCATGGRMVVETKGIEPSTFALRTRRSPS